MHKILQDLADAVINGDEKATEKQAQEALAEGIDPIEAVKEGLMKGMEVVGDRFQKFDIFLPQVARVVGAMKRARCFI